MAQWAAVPRFAIATLALAGLAWVVSFATEQLGERFGPAVTGMMQSTLGNLPELFVVIFALQKGELVVAQTAIVGSIFANAMLVLGLVIVVGALRAPRRRDALLQAAARDTATLLLVWCSSSCYLACRSPRTTPPATTWRRSRRSGPSACWSYISPGSCPICAPTALPGREAALRAQTDRPRRRAPGSPRERRRSGGRGSRCE